MQSASPDKFRIEAIDLARGLALAAMAVFHFAWDLEFFGYAPAGMTRETGWVMFARAIASSFLFLVGVSLFLAHGGGIRARSFMRRLAMVAAAAAAITAVTYFATPSAFIFFGILHQIALASVLGLLFLRLPVPAIIAAAALVLAAPMFLRHAVFDHPALWWVGLSTINPRANDYVPLFPWFAPVLLGIAAARLTAEHGLVERLARARSGAWTAPLQLAGRHSLLVYLLHQPVLIGAIWLFAQIAPPPAGDTAAEFTAACRAECQAVRSAQFCAAYCGCVLDEVEAGIGLDALLAGADDERSERVEEIAFSCSILADELETEEGVQ